MGSLMASGDCLEALIGEPDSGKVVGDPAPASKERRGRFDEASDTDDCRLFEGGACDCSGTTTADAIGLKCISDQCNQYLGVLRLYP